MKAFFMIAACVLSINAIAQGSDLCGIAYEITQKDMSQSQWNGYVQKANSAYTEWCNDNPSGDRKKFLDSRLLQMAPGFLSGNVPEVKKAVYWISLYREYNEPLPSYVNKDMDRYSVLLTEAMKNFSWERAALIIRNRKQRG